MTGTPDAGVKNQGRWFQNRKANLDWQAVFKSKEKKEEESFPEPGSRSIAEEGSYNTGKQLKKNYSLRVGERK